MQEEKRMAGDYEIIQALHIGDREIVIGENQAEPNGEFYMCAYCQSNGLFAAYTELMVSDEYAEIVKLFGKRVAEQAERARQELFKPKFQGIDNRPITAANCTVIDYRDDLHNKVVVLKPDALRREYRVATHQLLYCTGGFGASPHSRGSACYCVNLYTGEIDRYERMDVLGTLRVDQLPQWAKLGLEQYQQKQRNKAREAR